MKWKYSLVRSAGFAVGVLACILIACIWGPREETLELDLYSGQQQTIKDFLWYHRVSQESAGEHTVWAREHQRSNITPWYVMVCSTQRVNWFEPVVNADTDTRDVVRSIYNLSIPEEQKAMLLHEYWRDLDEARSNKPIDSIFEHWAQRLEDVCSQSIQKGGN